MATIEYTKYQFKPPSLLIEADFEILKEMLNENPDYNLNAPSEFFETFKIEFIILGVGVAGFFLAWLDIAEWLNIIGGILAFLLFALLGIIPSMSSFLGFHLDKMRFYNRLKSDIVKSESYSEFLTLREKRRWKLY